MYPRNVNASKIFRITVEEALALKNKNGSQSLEDFADKWAFGLESDIKVWKASIKAMDATQLRELQQLLKKREGLVGDALYKRTQ
jgi:hypothetical protein